MSPTDQLAALADIELPAPPDWRPMFVFAALALMLAAGLLIRHLRTRRDPARRDAVTPVPMESSACTALTRLARLQQQWEAGAIDARTTAYRLATLLRLGLGLPQLLPAAAPAGLDETEWRTTLTLLQGLRYNQTSPALTPEIFARARHWLSQRDAAHGEGRDV